MFDMWLAKDCDGELKLFYGEPKKENGLWRAAKGMPYWTELPLGIEPDNAGLLKGTKRKVVLLTEEEFDELGQTPDSAFEDLDMDEM